MAINIFSSVTILKEFKKKTHKKQAMRLFERCDRGHTRDRSPSSAIGQKICKMSIFGF